MMKAWIMFTGENPVEDGCLLAFAEDQEEVRTAARAEFQSNYIRVWRCSGYDRFASKFEPGVHVIYSNAECLAAGIPAYYDNVEVW